MGARTEHLCRQAQRNHGRRGSIHDHSMQFRSVKSDGSIAWTFFTMDERDHVIHKRTRTIPPPPSGPAPTPHADGSCAIDAAFMVTRLSRFTNLQLMYIDMEFRREIAHISCDRLDLASIHLSDPTCCKLLLSDGIAYLQQAGAHSV